MEINIRLSSRKPARHYRIAGQKGAELSAYRVVLERLSEAEKCQPFAVVAVYNRTADDALEWLKEITNA